MGTAVFGSGACVDSPLPRLDESGAGGDIVVTRYLTEGELDELKSYRVRIIK